MRRGTAGEGSGGRRQGQGGRGGERRCCPGNTFEVVINNSLVLLDLHLWVMCRACGKDINSMRAFIAFRKGKVKMRKVLLAVVIAGFALVVFVSVRPQVENLVLAPEAPATDISGEEQLTVEPMPYFSVNQGGRELAMVVKNNTSETISFSLGHEHAHLIFRPQGDSLGPGRSREIFVQAEAGCPLGGIELPVYLRAELNGERLGRETVLQFHVIPGELSLEQDQYGIHVLFNGETAPRGAVVYYRAVGESQWQVWGETPGTAPPRHLEPGDYQFEFKAELGDAETGVATYSVTIEEAAVKEEPEPETESRTAGSGSSASAAAARKEEPAGNSNSDDGFLHVVDIKHED